MKTLTKTELLQFSGDLVRYRHPLNSKVIYTPGVRHVAKQGGAYWLIDAIASWIGTDVFNEAAAKDDRISRMHFWTLTVGDDNAATLYAKADSPDDAFITQTIPFSDFPLSSIDIWAGRMGNTGRSTCPVNTKPKSLGQSRPKRTTKRN